MQRAFRLAPIMLLVTAFAAFWVLGGRELVSLDRLATEYAGLAARVAADRPLAVACFVLGYVALLSTVIFPASFVLTIAGGVLFGPVTGALAASVGVTIGGSISYLAARAAFAHDLARRLGPRAARLADGIASDGLAYLIVLRITPLFPFWLVTLAAAAARLSVRQFVIGTFFGTLPACFVFAGLGASAATTLAAGDALSIEALATSPATVAPLMGLALLGAAALWLRGRMAARAKPLADAPPGD